MLRKALRLLLGGLIVASLLVVAGLWWRLPPWPRATLPSGPGRCKLIHISENGQTLVAVHPHALAVWDVALHQQLGVMPYQGRLDLRLSPDGQTLAIADFTNPNAGWVTKALADSVRPWQPARQTAPIPLPGSHDLIDITSDGQFLLTFTAGKGYTIWETATGKERPFPIVFSRMEGVHLLGNGRIVVSDFVPESGWLVDTIGFKLWSFNADLTLACEPIYLPGVVGPVISPDGRFCAAVGTEGESGVLKLYQLSTGREIASFPSEFPGSALFSPDATRLITDDHTIWHITTAPPRRLGALAGLDVIFSPDGKWLAVLPDSVGSGCPDWEILDAASLQKLNVVMSRTSAPTFAPNGGTIVGRGMHTPSALEEWIVGWFRMEVDTYAYEALQVRELPGGQVIASYAQTGGFAFFPDGRRIAVGKGDGTIEIWDIPPRRPWWIEYGLPVVFGVLVFLSVRLVWRAIRRAGPAEGSSC